MESYKYQYQIRIKGIITFQKIFPCFRFFSDIPIEYYKECYYQIKTMEFIISSNIYRSDFEIREFLHSMKISDLDIVRKDSNPPPQVEQEKPKLVYRLNYLSSLKVYEIFFQNSNLTIQGRFTPTEFEEYLFPMISTMINK
jgi:hypothetical protein